MLQIVGDEIFFGTQRVGNISVPDGTLRATVEAHLKHEVDIEDFAKTVVTDMEECCQKELSSILNQILNAEIAEEYSDKMTEYVMGLVRSSIESVWEG